MTDRRLKAWLIAGTFLLFGLRGAGCVAELEGADAGGGGVRAGWRAMALCCRLGTATRRGFLFVATRHDRDVCERFVWRTEEVC